MLSFSVFSQFRNFKIIYRRYAGLYFCICVDVTDNNLAYLEGIHNFVEVTDASHSPSLFVCVSQYRKHICSGFNCVGGNSPHSERQVQSAVCFFANSRQIAEPFLSRALRIEGHWMKCLTLRGSMWAQSEFSLGLYLLNLVFYMAACPERNIKSINCIFMFMSPIAYSQQDVIVLVLAFTPENC